MNWSKHASGKGRHSAGLPAAEGRHLMSHAFIKASMPAMAKGSKSRRMLRSRTGMNYSQCLLCS